MFDPAKDISCPYLGLDEDPDTRLTFPSPRHVCLNVLPVQMVRLEHQAVFCLSENHATCPIFVNPVAHHLPPEIAATGSKFKWQTLVAVLGGLVVLGALLILNWWQFGGASAPPTLAVIRSEVAARIEAMAQITPTPLALRPSPSPFASSPASPFQKDAAGASHLFLPGLYRPDPNVVMAPEPVVQGPVATVDAYPQPLTTIPSGRSATCLAPPGWLAYTVQRGDTLYELGLFTGSSVAEIMEGNCMSSSVIRVGQQLLLPVLPRRTAAPAPTKTPRPQATQPAPTATQPPAATPTDAPPPYPYPNP